MVDNYIVARKRSENDPNAYYILRIDEVEDLNEFDVIALAETQEEATQKLIAYIEEGFWNGNV